MHSTIDLLRDLHAIHEQLEELSGRLRRGPLLVRAQEARHAELEAHVKQARADTTAVKMGADEKNLQLRTKEGRIADLKAKLNSCSTNKEYQALQEQIAADEMTCSILQDEILEALEKVDQCQAQVAEAEARQKTGKEELAKVAASVQAKEGDLKADLARAEARLVEAEQQLPDDVRAEYRRIVKNKGADGMAVLEGENCGGCNQSLPPNVVNNLMLGRVTVCGGCGRMLYLPEDRSPGKG